MNNKKPLVSICCITYNHAPYIRQCLQGFMMQKTNFSFEVLIHDDCSTDGTTEIIKEYELKFPDIIKPIYEKVNQFQNGKPSGSIVWNYPRAKGKYIAMCEGDDYWIDASKLQKEVDFLESHSDYGLVYTNVHFFFQEQNKFKKNYITSNKLKQSHSFIEHLSNQGYIAPCSWLFRSCYIDYSMDQSYVDLTFPLALDIWAKSKVHFMNESTAVYRVLTESASHSRSLRKCFEFGINLFKIQKDYMNKYHNLVSDEDRINIYLNIYSCLLPSAIVLNKIDFINEVRHFTLKKNDFKISCLLFLSKSRLFTKLLRFLYKQRNYLIN